MKYQRMNATLQNIWNRSLRLQIDMYDENGEGWTMEQWLDRMWQNAFPYIMHTSDWIVANILFMDVVKC